MFRLLIHECFDFTADEDHRNHAFDICQFLFIASDTYY